MAEEQERGSTSTASASREADAIDVGHFRAVLGRFPTGAVVITGTHRETPYGLAVNSFTSVSLDPPLVLFCAGKNSDTWPFIRESGHFAVNFVAGDQESVCRNFARKGVERFSGVRHDPSPSGCPVLEEALAFIDCRIQREDDAGDHVIVIGQVLSLGLQRETPPLVFYRGGFHRLAA